SHTCRTIHLLRRSSAYNLREEERSWMVCMSVYSVHVAQRAAHRSAGTRSSLSGLQDCSWRTDSCPVGASSLLKNVYPTWSTPSLSSAVMASRTVSRFVQKG